MIERILALRIQRPTQAGGTMDLDIRVESRLAAAVADGSVLLGDDDLGAPGIEHGTHPDHRILDAAAGRVRGNFVALLLNRADFEARDGLRDRSRALHEMGGLARLLIALGDNAFR